MQSEPAKNKEPKDCEKPVDGGTEVCMFCGAGKAPEKMIECRDNYYSLSTLYECGSVFHFEQIQHNVFTDWEQWCDGSNQSYIQEG